MGRAAPNDERPVRTGVFTNPGKDGGYGAFSGAGRLRRFTGSQLLGRCRTKGSVCPWTPHGPPEIPRPLHLVPAKGSSNDIRRCSLIQTVPHSRRSATACAWSRSVPHTEPHRP